MPMECVETKERGPCGTMAQVEHVLARMRGDDDRSAEVAAAFGEGFEKLEFPESGFVLWKRVEFFDAPSRSPVSAAHDGPLA